MNCPEAKEDGRPVVEDTDIVVAVEEIDGDNVVVYKFKKRADEAIAFPSGDGEVVGHL